MSAPFYLKRPLARVDAGTVTGDAVTTLWSSAPPVHGKVLLRNLDATYNIWLKLRKFDAASATFAETAASYVIEPGQTVEIEVPGNVYFDLLNSSAASTSSSYLAQEFA